MPLNKLRIHIRIGEISEFVQSVDLLAISLIRNYVIKIKWPR